MGKHRWFFFDFVYGLFAINNVFFYSAFIIIMKGSLGAVVKLLPCDHEVTGSIPGNSLLQKCRERLHAIDPKWSDSLSVMCVVRAKYMYLFLIPKTSQTEIHSIDSVCSISASNIGVKTSSYQSVVSVQCLTDIIL